MHNQQRIILALIATGRITAADALRLEALWVARRQQMLEIVGAIALCVLVLLTQSAPIAAVAHSLGHSALNLIHHVAGGTR